LEIKYQYESRNWKSRKLKTKSETPTGEIGKAKPNFCFLFTAFQDFTLK